MLYLSSAYENDTNHIWARREKTCLRGFANNKCVDQPAHQRRLISAFVIRFLKSIISKLASREIFVAGETGLSLALSETSKTGFSRRGPILLCDQMQVQLSMRKCSDATESLLFAHTKYATRCLFSR